MRSLVISSVLFGIALAAANTLVLADDHDNHQYVKHEEWKKGAKIQDADWKRGDAVPDYRSHHLRTPPHGYEWRLVDGNYVLAAAATGVIASVVAAEASGH
jgi:Ni/Co efflux regulator RcnB